MVTHIEYMYLGTWLAKLISAYAEGCQVLNADDPLRREIGFQTGDQGHFISLKTLKNQQEWFQTESQRNHVLAQLGVSLEVLWDLMGTPDGRQRLYQQAKGG